MSEVSGDKRTLKANRFLELEGLRGIAALVVVIFHALVIFYAGAFYGSDERAPVQHFRLEDNIYANPLAGLLSGAFAVAIFFVLSGFVLSIGYFQTGKTSIIKSLAAKRYLRLMLPALASIIFAYVAIVSGVSHTQEIPLISHSIEGAQQWNLVPNLFNAIRGGVFGIFFLGGDPYNRVLWTMYTEFTGSFLIFAFLLLFGKSRYRWVLYSVLIFLTFNNLYLGFILGMIFADMYSIGYIKQRRRNWLALSILLLAGIILGGYPDGKTENTFYAVLNIIPLDIHNIPIRFYTTVGAAVVLLAVLQSSQIANFLRRKQVSILGKYTFSLYLVHMTILYTLTTGLFLHLYPYIGYNKSATIAIGVSIPVIWVVTVLFERYVDKPSIKLATYFADIYLGKRELQWRPRLASAREKAATYLATVQQRIRQAFIRNIEVIETEAE